MASISSAARSERLLICAPFGRDAALIKRELQAAGLEAAVCVSVQDLAAAISEGAGAALIADEALRPPTIQSLAREIAQQPPWSDFPIIVMTAGGETPHGTRYRVDLLEPLGNVSLLERPLRIATLISSMKTALRARRHQYRLCDYLEEREQKEQSLRLANRDLEQFAYSASHDLQEPLRMVSIYSQLLKANYGPSLNADGTLFLDYLVTGAKRMGALLKDLLAYTQVVQGQPEPSSTTDANAVLEQSLSNLESVIRDTNASIEAEVLPSLELADVHLLQLFQNLIGNALKYRGSDRPHVRVYSYRQPDGTPVVCVRDNGIGIDPQHHARIFGIFKRLHRADRYEGTGIGLALCQKIVERYGGRIWVDSEGEGRGSTFCFTIGKEPAHDPAVCR